MLHVIIVFIYSLIIIIIIIVVVIFFLWCSGFEPRLWIYYAFFLPTEVSSRGLVVVVIIYVYTVF